MSTQTVVGEFVESRWGSWGRAKRAAGYAVVGITGIPVDLGVLTGLLAVGVHHLLAISVSYLVAMTWNFALQRRFVYHGSGQISREYARYVFVDVSAFAIRAAVVFLTVDLAHPWLALPYIPAPIDPSLPASALGIAVAFVIGSQGTEELVFGGDRRGLD